MSSVAARQAPFALVRFEGHLDVAQLDRELEPAGRRIREPSVSGLIVDCREMTSYDSEARSAFVTWNRSHRQHLERVAILTDELLWHMVIRAMSLASGQTMRPFDGIEDAQAWVSGG